MSSSFKLCFSVWLYRSKRCHVSSAHVVTEVAGRCRRASGVCDPDNVFVDCIQAAISARTDIRTEATRALIKFFRQQPQPMRVCGAQGVDGQLSSFKRRQQSLRRRNQHSTPTDRTGSTHTRLPFPLARGGSAPPSPCRWADHRIGDGGSSSSSSPPGRPPASAHRRRNAGSRRRRRRRLCRVNRRFSTGRVGQRLRTRPLRFCVHWTLSEINGDTLRCFQAQTCREFYFEDLEVWLPDILVRVPWSCCWQLNNR